MVSLVIVLLFAGNTLPPCVCVCVCSVEVAFDVVCICLCVSVREEIISLDTQEEVHVCLIGVCGVCDNHSSHYRSRHVSN